jgi:nitronate monooxygenase
VIRTPYTERLGVDLPWAIKILKENPLTKKYVVPLIHLAGMRQLEKAADTPTWKTVWSAGQSVGLVNEILSVREIFAKLMSEYEASVRRLK